MSDEQPANFWSGAFFDDLHAPMTLPAYSYVDNAPTHKQWPVLQAEFDGTQVVVYGWWGYRREEETECKVKVRLKVNGGEMQEVEGTAFFEADHHFRIDIEGVIPGEPISICG